MKIKETQQQVHTMAISKGWWPELNFGPISHQRIAVALSLIHSEVSEALEEVRSDNLETYWVTPTKERVDSRDEAPPDAKPEGLPIELADVVIRCMDLAGALGIDLEQAIADKVAFNANRKHRHGGRTL
jgi:NTP pyrophosphatase (non-canonical NTP hydrolase)